MTFLSKPIPPPPPPPTKKQEQSAVPVYDRSKMTAESAGTQGKDSILAFQKA